MQAAEDNRGIWRSYIKSGVSCIFVGEQFTAIYILLRIFVVSDHVFRINYKHNWTLRVEYVLHVSVSIKQQYGIIAYVHNLYSILE